MAIPLIPPPITITWKCSPSKDDREYICEFRCGVIGTGIGTPSLAHFCSYAKGDLSFGSWEHANVAPGRLIWETNDGLGKDWGRCRHE
jgi:hypothetical protein